MLYNFLSAIRAFGGALVAYFLSLYVQGFIPLALAFAAGGFIYVACVDLMPRLQQEMNPLRGALQLAFMLAGVAIMWNSSVMLS